MCVQQNLIVPAQAGPSLRMGPGGRGETSSLPFTDMQRLEPAHPSAPGTPSSVSAAAAARQITLAQVCTQLGSDQTGASSLLSVQRLCPAGSTTLGGSQRVLDIGHRAKGVRRLNRVVHGRSHALRTMPWHAGRCRDSKP